MTGSGPKRVAYVDHAADFGGAENSLIELISRLDRSRITPVLLYATGARWTQSNDVSEIERVPVFPSHPLLEQKRDQVTAGPVRVMRNVWSSIQISVAVRSALRRTSADLVHTNSLKGHFLGGLAARLTRLPLVWHVRDLLAGDEGYNLLRRAARLLRPRVIAISQAVAEQFAGLPLEVTVIPNGIPLDKFCPGLPSPRLRRELGLATDDRVLLVVSRLTPWKGHMTLLEAVARLTERWPRLKLVVVGEVAFWEADYEQHLKQRATELGLAQQVIWTGFRSDVPELLRLCEIFVLPSVREPFGRAIVEAMAVGRPVVATASGGVPEVVVDGQSGLLVPPEDAQATAEAIERLLDDPERARQMGAKGLTRTRKLFDVDRVAHQVQQLYQQMFSGDP